MISSPILQANCVLFNGVPMEAKHCSALSLYVVPYVVPFKTLSMHISDLKKNIKPLTWI